MSLLSNALLVIAALLPPTFLMLWVWRRDRLPEPSGVVGMTLLLGALTVLPAGLIEVALARLFEWETPPKSTTEALLIAFVMAALVEESLKFAVLGRYSARHDAFDEAFDGIVYGVAASLGFAAAENLLYVLQHGFGTAIARALMAVPMHAACGVLMGSCIGIGRFARRMGFAWSVAGFVGAVLLHGTYDAFLFTGQIFSEADRDGTAAACVVGALGTLLLGGGACALGIARMRRDQERTLAAPLQGWTPPAIPGLEAPAVPVAIAPPPPLPRAGAPRLPMAALLCGVAASGCTVLLAMVGYAFEQVDEEHIPESIALLALVLLLLGALGTLAGFTLGIAALVRQPRWRAASVTGLVLSALAPAVVVAGLLSE